MQAATINLSTAVLSSLLRWRMVNGGQRLSPSHPQCVNPTALSLLRMVASIATPDSVVQRDCGQPTAAHCLE